MERVPTVLRFVGAPTSAASATARPVPRPDRGPPPPHHPDLRTPGHAILADRAYPGAGPWGTTGRERPPGGQLSPTRQAANRALAAASRAHFERGVARLKSWRIFRKSRISPNRMTSIVQDVLILVRQR